MIVDFFIDLALSVVLFFVGLLDIDAVPQNAVLDLGAGFAPWAHGISDLGVWLPWATLAIWIPIVGACYFAFTGLKFLKNLFSHVPFFGGKG